MIYERVRLNRHVQQEGESVEDYIFDVHTLMQHCVYAYMGHCKIKMICDQMVAGINDASLSEKLQMDNQLPLETTVKKAKGSETIKQ